MRVVIKTVSNPPNPWQSEQVELLDEPQAVKLEVFEEHAKSVISETKSPDIAFRYSVNPYRGCYHACAYCYARPYHQYIGFGAGTDFDRKIVVKINAPAVLRKELSRKSWKREVINFSGITDCYQPLEASYRITRQCLEVCADFLTPVTIITKNRLVERDIDVLLRLKSICAIEVYFTVSFIDDGMRKKIEPGASPIEKRLQAMQTLSSVGIHTGVAVSPILPGLNDDQIIPILNRAREAGAQSAFMTLIRLPAEVRAVFEKRLEESYPLRAGKVLHGIEEMREGKRNTSVFGQRMKGVGPRWEILAQIFEKHCARLGLRNGHQIVSPENPMLTTIKNDRQLSLL